MHGSDRATEAFDRDWLALVNLSEFVRDRLMDGYEVYLRNPVTNQTLALYIERHGAAGKSAEIRFYLQEVS